MTASHALSQLSYSPNKIYVFLINNSVCVNDYLVENMFLVAVFSKKTHNTREMGWWHRRIWYGVHFEFHETVSLSAETLHALSIDAR